MAKKLTSYVYSKKVNRYFRRSDGRLVPPSEIRKAFDRMIDKAERALVKRGHALQAGQITTAKWFKDTAADVRALQSAGVAIPNGGIRNLSDAARQQLGDKLEFHIGKLENLLDQIQSGKQPLNGRFIQRLKLYARTSRQTYEEVYLDAQEQSGVETGRRVLHPAEHCVDCLFEESRGEVPIDEVAPPGFTRRSRGLRPTICSLSCKCTVEYLKGQPSRAELKAESARIRKRVAA